MTQPQSAAPPPLPLGSPAPPFTAVAGTGEELTLAQFLGKRVVIAFYPFDFTGG
jgi:peroxiredoxin